MKKQVSRVKDGTAGIRKVDEEIRRKLRKDLGNSRKERSSSLATQLEFQHPSSPWKRKEGGGVRSVQRQGLTRWRLQKGSQLKRKKRRAKEHDRWLRHHQ